MTPTYANPGRTRIDDRRLIEDPDTCESRITESEFSVRKVRVSSSHMFEFALSRRSSIAVSSGSAYVRVRTSYGHADGMRNGSQLWVGFEAVEWRRGKWLGLKEWIMRFHSLVE